MCLCACLHSHTHFISSALQHAPALPKPHHLPRLPSHNPAFTRALLILWMVQASLQSYTMPSICFQVSLPALHCVPTHNPNNCVMVEVFRLDLWGLRNGACWIFSSENPLHMLAWYSTTFTPSNHPCTCFWLLPPQPSQAPPPPPLLFFSSLLGCKDLACKSSLK